jgi:hypothetical protein
MAAREVRHRWVRREHGSIRKLGIWILLGLAAGSAVAMAGACASKGTIASQLRFVDSEIFEKDLQASMSADKPTITVAFAGTDATMSNMPDRLEKWLFVINERDDGEVKFEPDPAFLVPKNPIPLGLAFSVGMAAWGMYKNWAHYAMASDYNALVFYHPSEAYLTRVVFVRKKEADS